MSSQQVARDGAEPVSLEAEGAIGAKLQLDVSQLHDEEDDGGGRANVQDGPRMAEDLQILFERLGRIYE